MIVEIKAVANLVPAHDAQVLTYLRLLKLPVGLLINFGAPTFKAGVQRIVNNYVDGTQTMLDSDLPAEPRLCLSAPPPLTED